MLAEHESLFGSLVDPGYDKYVFLSYLGVAIFSYLSDFYFGDRLAQ